jgi:NhaP-type Na+/H+ or K+/H+ antiporter
MFYALTAQDSTGLQTLWPIVSLAAAASVVAHGITGTPVTAFLHKKESASFLKKRSKKLLTFR